MERFQGPLGIWPWPIVNLVLALISSGFSGASPSAPPSAPRSEGVSNVEVWEWVDSMGRRRTITVHRRVEG